MLIGFILHCSGLELYLILTYYYILIDYIESHKRSQIHPLHTWLNRQFLGPSEETSLKSHEGSICHLRVPRVLLLYGHRMRQLCGFRFHT